MTAAEHPDDTARTSFDGPNAASADTTSSIPVSRFDKAYEAGRPPWDVDGPQPDVARLVQAGQITGRVLDVGCGTGEHALFFAARGMAVVGIDASSIAVRRARDRARERDLPGASFVAGDAVELAGFDDESFDAVTDSGFLHVLSDERRATAIASIHRVLRPGGSYWVMCFNEHAVHPGPRRMTQAQLRALFSDGWEVVSIESAAFELRSHDFGENASTAWLARVLRR